MKIISIQAGLPQVIHFKNKDILTAFVKTNIESPVMLRFDNLDGDKQAELSVHGGRDKALYAYSQEAYSTWKKLRPDKDFPNGALGENLTVEGMDEKALYIGDTFELGEAIVQISEPRFPCFKLGAKFGDLRMIKQFLEVNRSGVYFRVLKEGMIDVGDEFKLISQESVKLSVHDLFTFEKNGDQSRENISNLLKISSLTMEWRQALTEYLK